MTVVGVFFLKIRISSPVMKLLAHQVYKSITCEAVNPTKYMFQPQVKIKYQHELVVNLFFKIDVLEC